MIKKTVNSKPLTAAERQRKRRIALKQAELYSMHVRGKSGYFDERIRVAMAVKNLAGKQEIPLDVLNKILEESVKCIHPQNLVEERYIKRLMSTYLSLKEKGEENAEY